MTTIPVPRYWSLSHSFAAAMSPGAESMPGRFEARRHVRARLPQDRGEPLGIFHRHDRIVFAGRKQNARVSQIRQDRRHERNHRAKQDGAGQHFRPEEENCRRDVRAIGISNGSHRFRVELISRGSRAHKIGEFMRAMNYVFFIEDAFSQAPEKSRHAVLENLAARTQQRRGGIEVASEGNHIVFIAARPMQEQKSALARPRWRWNKTMNEIHTAHIS